MSLVEVESAAASPFASSLLFDYIATYMYEGDAPNAERRARRWRSTATCSRELLGQDELRELLDRGGASSRSKRTCSGAGAPLRATPTGSRPAAPAGRPVGGRAARARRGAGDGRGVARRAGSASGEPCACGSPASRAGSPPRTPGLFRDALGVVPPAGPARVFLEPTCPMRCAARAALRPHPRPLRGGRLRARWHRPLPGAARRSSARGERCEGELRPGGRGASGAPRTCCGGCGGARWPRCGERSSRSSPTRLGASCRPGRASAATGAGAGSTACARW